MRIVVGITGASGVVYGITFLKNLREKKYLVVSESAREIIEFETSYSIKEVEDMADECYSNSDLSAPISSGSLGFDAMVIIPCSLSTLSKIAWGICDNLITRVACVCLKEGRKLVLVPRETPLSTIHLENMYKLSQNGVVILPAMPAFYIKPKEIRNLVDFVVGRVLDSLGIESNLYQRWKGK